ncbi:type IV secretory system conjugative DNA transfer family protein [Ruegeria sp.]|uniref:type IV secretory system conjugative DNA transfer family protein n=1 Tax=Ruegeria sp. TaxID=1879320 RepID=UPI003AFFE95B
MTQLQDALRLIEAAAYGLLMAPFAWMTRRSFGAIDNPETGLGETGIPWRWAALCMALAFCGLVALYQPRAHKRLAFAIGLVSIGAVWGIGINGTSPYMLPGNYWDIEALWAHLGNTLTTTNPHYTQFVSIARLSGTGLGLALLGMILTIAFGELPVREIRASRKHRGSNRYRSAETVFGDAQWSSWTDIRNIVGDPEGIVLGEDYDPRKTSRRFNPADRATWGPGGTAGLITLSTGFAGGHSLVFAGTGAGKTAGIVFPTALTYRHPIIFMDPQHEIHETVAAARAAMGFEARVIEIGNGIDLIKLLRPWLEKSPIAYMHLADSLVGKQDGLRSEYSQFYASEGATLMSGLLQCLVEGGAKNVFQALYDIISKPEKAFKDHVTEIVEDQEANEAVKKRLGSFAEMEEKLFSNLQSNIKQALNWASFPDMCAVLDADPDVGATGKDTPAPKKGAPARNRIEAATGKAEDDGLPDVLGKTTDVYIRLGISDLQSFPGIVRCILSALLYCINEGQDGIERLMIVDEAYQVGRLQGFELLRDTMRKRGLHLMLIFQSTGQLEKLYGKEGVRAWNSSVAARVYGPTEDPTDQAELSRMIGEYTVDIEGKSRSTSLRGFGIGTPSSNVTRNVNLQKANLMRPEQLRTLPNDGLVLFYKGQNPLVCGMAFSFRREEWQGVTPFREGTSTRPYPTQSDRFGAWMTSLRNGTAPAEKTRDAKKRRP